MTPLGFQKHCSNQKGRFTMQSSPLLNALHFKFPPLGVLNNSPYSSHFR